MTISCFRMKDEKLEFAELNSMTFHPLHLRLTALLFRIVYENRANVNQKTFPAEIRESASLTMKGKALDANATRDTQGPHAVSFFFCSKNLTQKSVVGYLKVCAIQP